MRRLFYMAMLGLLAVMLSACHRSEIALPEESGARLSIFINFPERTSVKAEGQQYEADDEENAIHSLRIWVYDEEKKTLVTPMLKLKEGDPDWDFPEDGGVKEFRLPVDWSFVLNPPRVRVYALANAESIGFSLPENYTMQDLNDAVFGTISDENDGPFGVTSPLVRSVPETGLPMSGLKTNMIPFGTPPLRKLEPVTIQRMVSRIRLVFCKAAITAEPGNEDEIPEVSITNVTFIKNRIPKKEYVFTEGVTGICYSDQYEVDNNYVQRSFMVPWDNSKVLREHDTPEDFIYVNQDPKTYNDLLEEAIENNQLTDLGYVYLRETDRKLAGTVYYTVTKGVVTEEHKRDFAMSYTNDFARNHTWTLFAYFLTGRNLNLRMVVMPWDKVDYDVKFSNQSVNVSRKLEVDEQTVELTETSKDHFDAVLIPSVVAHASLFITTPVNGTLYVKPVGGSKYFIISTDKDTQQDTQTIRPDVNSGRVDIYIRPSDLEVDPEDVGTLRSSITLSFSVEVNDRYIDADSEAIDKVYRFYR